MLTTIIDLLFPRTCHLCDNLLAREEKYICTTCLSRMPRTIYHRRDMNPMEQRFAGIFPFERATGHFFYSRNSDLSVLMQDLKYRHFRGLAEYLGSVVAKELLPTGFFSDIDLIAPVPMHFIKKARRGYNQTEEIARGISGETGIPVSLALTAARPHYTQTALSLYERRKNTEGMFRLKRPEEFRDRHILLLDDVCTSGSTLISAGTEIHAKEKSARISILTLGVTF